MIDDKKRDPLEDMGNDDQQKGGEATLNDQTLEDIENSDIESSDLNEDDMTDEEDK